MLERIISGGQTGVDRAALDVALAASIPCGGWCPAGRRAEDGPISSRYPLRETITPDYAERTERNVQDSDGTLVLLRGEPSGGTALTIELARSQGKPCMIVDLNQSPRPRETRAWIKNQSIRVLNVAGPRESSSPGIYEQSREFLLAAVK